MARLKFGGTLASWYVSAVDSSTSFGEGTQAVIIPAGAITIDVYDSPNGTILTDLLDALGNPITNITVPAGSPYIPVIQGPDGVTVLWVQAADGTWLPMQRYTIGEAPDTTPSPSSADIVIGSDTPGDYYALTTATGAHLYDGADAGAALQAAITALGAAGGMIAVRSGEYVWGTVPQLPANLTGWLRIIGADSVIQLSTAGSRFLDFNKQAAGDTFRLLHVEGFVVDAADLAAVGGTQHIIIGTARPGGDFTSGEQVNFEDIVLRRLTSKNVRVAASATAHHLNIFLAVHQTAAAQPQNTIKRILIEDIDLDGGNHGVTVYANKSSAWVGAVNVFLDEITIRRVRHTLRTPSSGFDSCSHVHVASLGYGETCVVEDVWGYGTRDVGVEVDGMMDVKIRRVTVGDFDGFGVAITNYHATARDVAAQVYELDGIYGTRSAGVYAESATSLIGVRTQPGIPFGSVKAANVHMHRTGPNSLALDIAGELASVKGDVRGFQLERASYVGANLDLAAATSAVPSALFFHQITGGMTLKLRDVSVSMAGANSGSMGASAIRVVESDVYLELTDCRSDLALTAAGEANGIQLGAAAGTVISGTIKGYRHTNPGAAWGSGIFVDTTTNLTIGDVLRIEDCDFGGMTNGFEIQNTDAVNQAKTYSRKNVFKTGVQPLGEVVLVLDALEAVPPATPVGAVILRRS